MAFPDASQSLPATSIQIQRATTALQATPPASFACGSPVSIQSDLAFPPNLGLINRTVGLFTTGSLPLSAPVLLAQGTAITTTLPKDANSISVRFDGDSQVGPASIASSRISLQPVPVTVQIASTPLGGGVSLTWTTAGGRRRDRGGNDLVCGGDHGPGRTGATGFASANRVYRPHLEYHRFDSSQLRFGDGGTAGRAHTFVANYAGDSLHQAGVSAPVTVTFQ